MCVWLYISLCQNRAKPIRAVRRGAKWELRKTRSETCCAYDLDSSYHPEEMFCPGLPTPQETDHLTDREISTSVSESASHSACCLFYSSSVCVPSLCVCWESLMNLVRAAWFLLTLGVMDLQLNNNHLGSRSSLVHSACREMGSIYSR